MSYEEDRGVFEEGFVPIREVAKRLGLSIEQVLFLIEDGTFTAYVRHHSVMRALSPEFPESKYNYWAMKMPVKGNLDSRGVSFAGKIYCNKIIDEVDKEKDIYCVNESKREKFSYPTGKILIHLKELYKYIETDKEDQKFSEVYNENCRSNDLKVEILNIIENGIPPKVAYVWKELINRCGTGGQCCLIDTSEEDKGLVIVYRKGPGRLGKLTKRALEARLYRLQKKKRGR